MKKSAFLPVIIALAAVIYLLIALPTDRRLIGTASTHENIQYLTADDSKLEGGRRLRFAAYDDDCDMVQLCFSLKKNDRAFWQGKDIAITVNGVKVETWSFFTHSTWKRRYFSFLLENVEVGAQITFTYDGQTMTIE